MGLQYRKVLYITDVETQVRSGSRETLFETVKLFPNFPFTLCRCGKTWNLVGRE